MRPIFYIALLFLIYSCRQGVQNKETPLFSLLPSDKTGVDFVNQVPYNVMNDNNVLSYQYYYNGGGVCLGDINNDGLVDIYFTANKKKNRLYLNLGDMKFKDITDEAGVGSKRFSTGAVFVDINSDGYDDIYVCNSGVTKNQNKLANQLYINNGSGKFVEKAAKYGVDDPNHSTQAAFFDYDLDGDLDLYVMNHSTLFGVPKKIKDDKKMSKLSGRFLENRNGKYYDITKKAGLLKQSYGLGISVSDVNNDGYPDIYIANDFTIPDFFYINNGDGTFSDKQKELTKQVTWFGMGTDIADINNDGLLDIGVLDMAANDHYRGKTLMASMNPSNFYYMVNDLKYPYQYMFNSLQLNNGNGTFTNIANLSGVAKTDWSWGALFADFNNDGYKDYFVTNGFRKNRLDNDFQIELKKIKQQHIIIPKKIKEEIYQSIPETKLPNHLYINNKKLQFTDVSKKEGVGKPSFSNGAAYADLDNDGDIDLVVSNIDQEAFIYRNNLKNNKFIKINFFDSSHSSNFYNAKAYIYYGNILQMQEYSRTRGYQSCVEHNLHFGFPSEQTSIDSLIIVWNDQKRTVLHNIPIQNQTIKIEKKINSKSAKNKRSKQTLFKTIAASIKGINFKHEENRFDDFAEEQLLPHKQSMLGPFISVGDLNNDDLDDFFIGGAAGQSGKIYIQNKEGFYVKENSDFQKDKKNEDIGSLFFDFDNDNDLDLYVVSGGGGEFKNKEHLLQDRLYINDGTGFFKRSINILPKITSSGQQVKASDLDNDGDLDLFVGGRTVPGKYPYSPKSYILINDNGKFVDKTSSWFSENDLSKIGMVTDFLFTNLNEDNYQDLIIVGEWMPILSFTNTGNKFISTQNNNFNKLKGWWYSIEQGDFNKDGVADYLFGNIGKNIKFKATNDKPFHIYTNDFDNTGDQDIVLSYYYNGKKVPSRGRECSSGEIATVTETCKTYKDFAESSIEDIYGKQQIQEALHFEVNTFSTFIAISKPDGSFDLQELNIEAQFSAVNRFLVKDFDGDNNLDIVLGGNMYHTEVETARYDAGTGVFLKGNGSGSFEAFSVSNSGIYISKDVKDLDFISIKDKQAIIVANNSDRPQIIIQE